jgi:hypothetical protein
MAWCLVKHRDNFTDNNQCYSAGLRARWSEVRVAARAGNFLFTTASRLALRPTQPPIQWVPGALSVGVKQSREADHSLPPSSKVKNDWRYTSTPQYAFVELYHWAIQAPSGRGDQEKILCPCRESNPGHLARILVTMLTELSRLLK